MNIQELKQQKIFLRRLKLLHKTLYSDLITIDSDQIKDLINIETLVQRIEEGFIQYSNGNCVVPPLGELLFDNPSGEVHIESGYVTGGDYYVIKIAS